MKWSGHSFWVVVVCGSWKTSAYTSSSCWRSVVVLVIDVVFKEREWGIASTRTKAQVSLYNWLADIGVAFKGGGSSP